VQRTAVAALVRHWSPSPPSAEKALKLELRAAQRESASAAVGAPLAEAERVEIAHHVLAVTALRRRYDWLLASALRRAEALELPAVLSLEARAELLLALHAASTAHAADERAGAASLWLGAATCDAAGGDRARVDALARALAAECAREAAWPDLGTEASLPDWLVALWASSEPICSMAGGPAARARALAALAAAANTPGPVVLRANARAAGGRAALVESLAAEGVAAEPTAWSPWGVRLPAGRPRTPLGGGVQNLAAWRSGACELQDEGSQLIALATRAAPGARALDLCAGNGGKTLALAAMLQGRGVVVAHDPDARRLAQIGGRAARARVPRGLIATATNMDAVRALMPAGGYGLVLVDAPCSSTGVLRRHPSLRWELDERACARDLPALQRELLGGAAELVARGGTLVYATCALSKFENEEVAGWFEARAAAARLGFAPLPFGADEPLPPPPPADATAARRAAAGSGGGDHLRWLLPSVHGTDGFFIARWTRSVE
jgi:16S rRNA (cytosine967-C5)-methyltransferase